MSQFSLQGVYPPIPTPFDASDEVNLHALRSNVSRWNETGLSGLVALGSSGEFQHLAGDEPMRILETIRGVLAPGKYLVAGTGSPSTASTIRRTRRAAAAGADAVLVIPPHYFRARMGTRELEEHYVQVAEHSPVPVILYNMPSIFGIELGPELACKLSHHPNIVGLKDGSGNIAQLARCVADSAGDFAVMTGSGGDLLPALLMGCVGGVMALANVAPDECVKLYRMAGEGRWEEAAKLQHRLLAVDTAMTTRHGIPGLKAALDLLGYYGGNPRAPLLPAGGDEKREIENILKAAGLL